MTSLDDRGPADAGPADLRDREVFVLAGGRGEAREALFLEPASDVRGWSADSWALVGGQGKNDRKGASA